ncbi:HAMP domain-containing sensor histidine kinase [Uliginosibacterium sp. TH139]|uniref:sensor histidine kinase n=1 Tax=Uliginosibacterium sp. TH139 TaxID=2067453 RepID=UPI000C7AD6A7|nr:HAMP domain-containing sensor histidine kinase [Uliginosibacterium sp. TH139]PLK47080.1 hypothetical protein C0V76_18665 [Uliginosibacterium sp. TH139]
MREAVTGSPAARLLLYMRLLMVAGCVACLGVLLGHDGLTILGVLWSVFAAGIFAALWYLLERLQRLPARIEVLATPQQQEGEFLSAMGHDLRQPAQAIALFAATLSAHPLPDSSRKLVSGIESAVEQLSEQLEAVFAIAKLEAGRVECSTRPLSLDGLFSQAINSHLDEAHERQLHLRHVPTARRVLGDEAMLLKAIDRMVAHAVAITGEGGGVVLGARQRGSMVLIEVWDSSEGIAVELLPQVFIPGSSYGQNLKDRGLGLVLARRLAVLQGGQLTLASRAGRGCLLRLALPAA